MGQIQNTIIPNKSFESKIEHIFFSLKQKYNILLYGETLTFKSTALQIALYKIKP